jgi:hypothetical protein
MELRQELVVHQRLDVHDPLEFLIDVWLQSPHYVVQIGPETVEFVVCAPGFLNAVMEGERYGLNWAGMIFVSTAVPERWIPFVVGNEWAVRKIAATYGINEDPQNLAKHWEAIRAELQVAATTLSPAEFDAYINWRRSVERTNYFAIDEDAREYFARREQHRAISVATSWWTRRAWDIASVADTIGYFEAVGLGVTHTILALRRILAASDIDFSDAFTALSAVAYLDFPIEVLVPKDLAHVVWFLTQGEYPLITERETDQGFFIRHRSGTVAKTTRALVKRMADLQIKVAERISQSQQREEGDKEMAFNFTKNFPPALLEVLRSMITFRIDRGPISRSVVIRDHIRGRAKKGGRKISGEQEVSYFQFLTMQGMVICSPKNNKSFFVDVDRCRQVIDRLAKEEVVPPRADEEVRRQVLETAWQDSRRRPPVVVHPLPVSSEQMQIGREDESSVSEEEPGSEIPQVPVSISSIASTGYRFVAYFTAAELELYYLFAVEARKVMVGEGRPRVAICHEQPVEGRVTTDQLAAQAGCTVQDICDAIVRFEQRGLVRVIDLPAANGCRIIEILYDPEEVMDVQLGIEPRNHKLAATLPVLRGFEKELSLEDRQLEIATCLSSVPGSKTVSVHWKIYTTSDTARLILDCLREGTVPVGSEIGQKIERLLAELPDLRKNIGREGQGFFDRIGQNGNVRFRVNRQMAGRCLIVPAKAGEGNRTARLRTREFRPADHWVIALNALVENRLVPEFVVQPRTNEERVPLPEAGIVPRPPTREAVESVVTSRDETEAGVVGAVEVSVSVEEPTPRASVAQVAPVAVTTEVERSTSSAPPAAETEEAEIEPPVPPAPEVEEMVSVSGTTFTVTLPEGSTVVVKVPPGSVAIEDPTSLTDEELEARAAAAQQLSEAALSLAGEYKAVLAARRAAALAALEEEIAAAERALEEKRIRLEELRRQSSRT